MISQGRKRRGYWQKRRRQRNMLPLLLTLVIAGGILFWGGKILLSLTGNIKSQQASALMNVIQGSIEFSFADTDTWTVSTNTNDAKFISGDSLRTLTNSEASLTVFDRSILFLNENTEVGLLDLRKRNNGKNEARLHLETGEIWAKVDNADFGANSDSTFVIETPRSTINVRGTLFDIKVSANQETIRLLDGKVDVDVYHDEEKKESTNITVGVGQKLVLNQETVQRIAEGQEVLESIDQSFQESNWHLLHLDQFYPEQANQIRRRMEINNPPETTSEASGENAEAAEGTAAPVDESIATPEIITPADGTVIPASVTDVQIEGTAPPEAEFVTVNGYTLTKYIPGDRKWSYFASTKFGTLVPGENTYKVVATTRDGRASPEASIKVTYEGTNPTTDPEASTTEEGTVNSPTLDAPVITRPATGSFNDPFQTSSAIITITGLVDPKTQAVEVNGFRLRKFTPGKTDFSYIANANYGNLVEGTNVFTVTAFGPDGEKSSTDVTIIYTPLNLE